MSTPPATVPQPTTQRDAAIAWLLGRINYERVAVIPYQERQLKLDRMRQLLTRLGSPDAGMKIVHIAGTKGKGSTAKMTAAMLKAAGYRVGVYCSPHLESIEERFAVDGLPCSGEELVGLVDRLRPIVEAMDAECGGPAEGPTFFDLATAIAFLYFADKQVDAAMIEVGLGGRLDSTNVCLPAVSVITSISFDHTKQLGNTLAAIAGEKAGIIKPGVPVLSGVTEEEPRGAIAEVAREHGCRLIELGSEFGYSRTAQAIDFWHGNQRIERVELGPPGVHQAHNAAVALAVAAELREQGWSLPEAACRDGLKTLRLPGRVEVLPGAPTIVLDTAHNQASAQALVDSLDELGEFKNKMLILSVSSDKDVRAIVHALAPAFDRVIVTRYLENPRAVPVDQLMRVVQDSLPPGRAAEGCEPPGAALDLAISEAGADDLVCVAGSFFLAAELRPVVVQLRQVEG